MAKILRYVLSLVKTVVLGVAVEGDSIVVRVRPHKREQLRCPTCGRRCECHDHEPTRRWRAMDLARSRCFLEYRPARVRCPEHGVRVERVPWARPRSRFTRDFEDWVACLAVRCCMSAVSRVARVEWHSVGGICKRVYDDIESQRGAGRFDGLRRIGIDETSYKKGHKYLTVVVDHDRGCLVWAHEGYGRDVLNVFLDELTREQRRGIEVVTADGARWIKQLVKRRCPNARWVMDPFHVVEWMNDALDQVRCEEWQVAKAAARAATPKRDRPGRPRKGEETPPEAREAQELAASIKNSRYALVKNPEDLTERQREKLADVRRAGGHLFRAWDLKEPLPGVGPQGGPEGRVPGRRRVRGGGAAGRMAPRGRLLQDQAGRGGGEEGTQEARGRHRRRRAGHRERARGEHQQQDQGQRPHRVRVQEHGQPHRPAHAALL